MRTFSICARHPNKKVNFQEAQNLEKETSRMEGGDAVTLHNVQEAHERIKKYIHCTQVMTSASLDAMTGAKLFFKCENFQHAGVFKARGAFNAVFSLSEEEASHGVVTSSSGTAYILIFMFNSA